MPSFQFTYNNVLRLGVTSGVLAIPVVGGCVSSIAKALWPEDGDNPLNDLQAKVEQLAVQIEDDEWLTTLRGQLNQLRTGLKLVQIPEPVDKFVPNDEWKTNMKNLLFLSQTSWNYFVDPAQIQNSNPDDQPQHTVIYLVAYGTIHLSLLRDRSLHYDKIFSDAPTDNPEQTFKDALQKLLAKVDSDRKRAIEWRKGKVGIDRNTYHPIPSGTITSSTAPQVSYQVTDANDSGNNRSFGDQQAYAKRHCKNILWDITTADGGYTSNLDTMLDAQRWWSFMDPLVHPPSAGFGYWCSRFGSGFRNDDRDDNDDNYGEGEWNDGWAYSEVTGRMSKIELYWDSGALKGLNAYHGHYGSGELISTDLHGTTASSTQAWTFRDMEVITALGGYAGDWVDRLVINTNLRIRNGQPPLGNSQQGDSMIWNVTNTQGNATWNDDGIAYFSCITDGNNIDQLKIVWKRWDADNGANFPPERSANALDTITFDLPPMTTSTSGLTF